ECYLPAKKRKYGYFVLPILWKGQFIGRCDPKADRKTKMLNINYLMFEPDVHSVKQMMPGLARSLKALAKFNQCDHVHIMHAQSANIKNTLQEQLDKH
ncbi:MAG: hypothetical protein GF313_06570, partial [Caldithrix sp.]|nr:hypothetical protein [Caldithrix sp.]